MGLLVCKAKQSGQGSTVRTALALLVTAICLCCATPLTGIEIIVGGKPKVRHGNALASAGRCETGCQERLPVPLI